MGPRSVSQVFQQFQIARTQFAQAIAELAGRSDCVEQLLQENVLGLLHGLLTDVSPTIQQNAALAVGRLASHSPTIAEYVLRADLLRNLITVDQDRPNRYLKRAVLTSLKSFVKQSPEMAKAVIDTGGMDYLISAMEDFDAGVKEGAASALGSCAKHNLALATEVIGAGAVPLLTLALQEPEVNVRVIAASALADIAKHSPATAKSVLDSGAVPYLVRASGNPDGRLRRAALFSLASIAKHSQDMTETIIQSDIFPLVLEHAGHPDELVRKAATSLIKEIVKHSPDLARLVVEGGGLGVLVNSVVRNKGDNRLPAILALGYIAGHNPALSFSVIYSKGVDALALALNQETESPVGAAAAWSLGHIGRHSDEHAKHVTSVGLLPKILQVYTCKGASEEMKLKSKQALKMLLLRSDDLDAVEPLLTLAPPEIFKYVVAQYSKVLPKDPAARRNFVTSGGLRKIQEFLSPDCPEILKEHILLINSCFPPDVVSYFSPDYPQTLLDKIDQFTPNLDIDPTLWTEKLFSDTKIPGDVKDEIAALEKSVAKNKEQRLSQQQDAPRLSQQGQEEIPRPSQAPKRLSQQQGDTTQPSPQVQEPPRPSQAPGKGQEAKRLSQQQGNAQDATRQSQQVPDVARPSQAPGKGQDAKRLSQQQGDATRQSQQVPGEVPRPSQQPGAADIPRPSQQQGQTPGQAQARRGSNNKNKSGTKINMGGDAKPSLAL